jgi:20S proteasome alpha/beta subunit
MMVQWVPDVQKPTPLNAQWKVYMGKRMTLIIGAICSDGLYFCSDTEEGTPGGSKRAVHKLTEISDYPSWHLVLGASGFGPLCEIAMKRIAEAARRERRDFLAKHETIIGNEIKSVYDQYISDLLSEHKRYDRQVQLVLAVVDLQTKTSYLYRTDEEILYPVSEPFACTGAGQDVANYFLDRLFKDWRPPNFTGALPTTTEGEVLLQFVMKEGKAAVGGVGGNTETFVIHHGTGMTTHGTFGAGWEARQPNLQDIVNHFWRRQAPPPFKPSTSRKLKPKK